MNKEREGELMMLLLCVIESWFPILSIIAIALVGALYSYAFVITIATVALTLLLIRQKGAHLLFQRAAQKDLLLTSFYITLLFMLVFLGLRYTTAGNMAVIIFLQLGFAYLYFNVLGSERLMPLHTAGAIAMGIGAILMLLPEEFHVNAGDLMILAAAAIAPIANLYQKRARAHVSSPALT